MKANEMFQIINDTVNKKDNVFSVKSLCDIAGVSRSGYYAWIKAEPARILREQKDKDDFELILEAYKFRGYSKGARSIHMRLLHKGIRMNVKKIRRLMHKFNLLCPIRKVNPYRQLAKALNTSKTAPNVINRAFKAYEPRKALLTDITYLNYMNGVCYLSTILDATTHEILAYELSENLKIDFVINTVNMLIKKHGSVLDDTTIIHSDQGFHYTSNAFINKLKDNNFVQSMSRRGNCWDNAPQESFFGHMKDEIMYMISNLCGFNKVKSLIDDWIDYYNHDRYQWDLLKLSPSEYYEYLTTGYYPLPIYKNKEN